MQLSIISAIIGGIDQPKTLPTQLGINGHDLSHYLVTTVEGLNEGRTDREKALFYKCQPHRNFPGDVYIWVDGKVQVQASDFATQVLAALQGSHLAVLKHGSRACIYEEVTYIEQQIARGSKYLATRYAAKPIRAQVEAYRQIGYPAGAGLYDCCIVAARNTPEAQDVLNYWWAEVRDYNAFDQTALPFAAWRLGVEIKPITLRPGTISHVPHTLLK